MKRKTSTLLLITFISSFLLAQRYPHSYLDYPILNIKENKINFTNNKSWETFFSKTKTQWLEGNQKINIVHFGGSHIQADVWSNRMRQHFQNLSSNNNSGRGYYFPFRIIGSNGSPYLKTNHSGNWEGFRNSVNNHTSPFGLLGARALLVDSSSMINVWTNRQHCEDCYFDEIEIIYRDTMKSHCIKILEDTLKWIKENNEKSSTLFKLSKLTDSVSFSIYNTDSIGTFELFGLRLSNDQPGFCYHSVGVNGASVPSYLRCENLGSDLSAISPDLVIFSIGINDAYEPSFKKEIFKSNYDSLIQIVKNINPEVAILLTTNNDSYYKKRIPNDRVFLVREVMYELADKHQAGVWDFFEIMGGFNSITEWEKYGLAKNDKIHLTTIGYKLIGDLLFEAILKSYKEYYNLNG
tara:strand:- start:18032 stop:19258 length:1227 start_codon:yes stop_codon:yes gene_type:complete